MSKANLIAHLKQRPKICENRLSKLSLSITNNESSSELRASTKNLKLSLSPYASQKIQFKSFDKTGDIPLSKHLKINSKSKFTPIKKNCKNIISLSTLISEGRKQPTSLSKVSKNLEKKIKSCCESIEYADVYFDIFDEVIVNSKEFNLILKQLRSALSSIMKSQKTDRDYLKKTVENLEMLNKSYQNDCFKLNKAVKDLEVKLKQAHENFTNVSDKYIKIMKMTVDEKEVNQDNYTNLKHKIFIYQDMVFNLKDELGFYKRKSKKFCRLYSILEERGIPVEDIYLTEMKKAKVLPNYHGDTEIESNTDNEYLASNRMDISRNHPAVPSLNFLNLEKDSDSSSSDTSRSHSDPLIEF